MTKGKRKLVFIGIILLLLILIAVLFGNAIVNYTKNEYYLANYPREYTELVSLYAQENNLDESYVYAVIKTESGFDASAESNVGARGLMQIMQDTFDWIQFRLGDEGTTFDDMYDPETNIKYGCYLLGYLLDYFGGKQEATCAYHAGIGSVSNWLENKEYSDDGVTIDNIPTSDTAHYWDKITKAEEIYIEIYKMEDIENG